MKLSGSQRFIKWFTSASRFEKMVEESKQWQFTCKACGKTGSVWEAGGIRYWAKGNPSTMLKCPHCKKVAMQKLRKAV